MPSRHNQMRDQNPYNGHNDPVVEGPLLARNGHGGMSDLSPLSGVKRKSASASSTSESDPKRTSQLRVLSRLLITRVCWNICLVLGLVWL
jgi:hypothetical protein